MGERRTVPRARAKSRSHAQTRHLDASSLTLRTAPRSHQDKTNTIKQERKYSRINDRIRYSAAHNVLVAVSRPARRQAPRSPEYGIWMPPEPALCKRNRSARSMR